VFSRLAVVQGVGAPGKFEDRQAQASSSGVKFARLSAKPAGGEHSTGLGLSMVKKMVGAMNGKVWCESELCKGATFIVEFSTTSG
jgi:signal transduction histidine kinase